MYINIITCSLTIKIIVEMLAFIFDVLDRCRLTFMQTLILKVDRAKCFFNDIDYNNFILNMSIPNVTSLN